jgi:arylformamidase
VVVDVADIAGEISEEELLKRLPSSELERVILRTQCTVASGSFPARWPTLSSMALSHLLATGNMKLLGVDAPSVDDRESKTLQNHIDIFRSGAYVLENLDLRAIEPGVYELVALPLRVAGLDAAPVRAFLRPTR